MRREQDRTFSIHDSTISIWRLHADPSDWETYKSLRMALVRYGFTFHQCPRAKKYYRNIAHTIHTGKRQDVFFHSQITGRHTEFTFYEDVIRDNSNGGRWHFDKLSKMPYLRRLRTKLAMKRIIDVLLSIGFTRDDRNVYPADALAAVMKHRRELEDFQGPEFYTRPQERYNTIDADGVVMKDGDVRYFWDYSGRLLRGTVYRNINNMWWVVCNQFCYRNVANFQLFAWKPEMGRRRKLSGAAIQDRLDNELNRSVKAKDYAAIQRLAKCLAGAASGQQAVAHV